jgi:hypothetical protein
MHEGTHAKQQTSNIDEMGLYWKKASPRTFRGREVYVMPVFKVSKGSLRQSRLIINIFLTAKYF